MAFPKKGNGYSLLDFAMILMSAGHSRKRHILTMHYFIANIKMKAIGKSIKYVKKIVQI